MMILLRTVFIAVLVTLPASADDFKPDFSGWPDTAIVDIATGGLWKQGEHYGTYRAVVLNRGWEHTRSYLYLQWLESDEEQKDVKVLHTVPVSEFNAGDWRTVLNVDYQNDVFIIYHVLRGREGLHQSILKPDLPGAYSITFQRNSS